jgi:N-acetylglucosamine-6-phosphate deacetylase
MLPRHPNFIWEQLAADELCASVIVDGHHLPPATVKSMVRAKTPARTILVTDAIAAAGCAPGSYLIGELAVELSADGRVAEPGAAHLAGSALSMQNAVANTVCFTGLSLASYLGLEPFGRMVAEWDQSNCRLNVIQVTTGDG